MNKNITGWKKLEITDIAGVLVVTITRELSNLNGSIFHKYGDLTNYSSARLERVVNKLMEDKHIQKVCEIGLGYLHIELSWYSPPRRK